MNRGLGQVVDQGRELLGHSTGEGTERGVLLVRFCGRS